VSQKSGTPAPPLALDVIRIRLALNLSPREAGAITRRLADYPTDSHNVENLALTFIFCDEFQYESSMRDIGLVFDVNNGTIH
jgi:hypothetical protein